MRGSYWSHSRFANWIRNVSKAPTPLTSGTSEEWVTYHRACRGHSKFITWLTEDFMDGVQNFFCWPADAAHSVCYYINNRWINPTHVIRTGLKAGNYHEVETKILQGLFEELVNFVECQKANMSWGKYDDNFVPWTEKNKYLRNLTNWKSQHYGVRHLLWEMTLVCDEDMGYSKDNDAYGKPTPQAIAASEILYLYVWWKFIRPMRKDPHDESGWRAYCDERRNNTLDTDGIMGFLSQEKTPEEKSKVRDNLDRLHKLEEQQYDEDTENLIKLITIRASLCT